jgi:flavorubredoxin
MVHWPEVMVSYDTTDKILFSADGFGKFGANDVEDPEGWDCEARRYYIGIVGKYGPQTQALLQKAAGLDIRTICPLHGPVLSTPDEIAHALAQYTIWSSYAVESPGVMIAYTSVYGHTKAAALKLRERLLAKGCPKVAMADLARDDQPEAVEDAFRYGKLVLATTTYNGSIFPWMRHYIDHLTERNYQKRTVAFIENGSWFPCAARVMREMFASCSDIVFAANTVTIRGALNDESHAQLEALADELVK